MTYYDEPPASDGKGGPHPLAHVPQEALDAATNELKSSLALHGVESMDEDEIESAAHSVLLVALVIIKKEAT
jgi:hypothetical protein